MPYRVTDTIIVDQSRNLNSIGIATFSGPVVVGVGTSTRLTVTGDVNVSGIVTGSVLVATKDPGTGIATDSTESIFGNGWRLSAPASTTYYRLATLPAGGGGNTFDHLIINGTLGSWLSNQQTPFEIYFSNRNTFTSKYISYGSVRSDVRILGISTNSAIEVWAQHQASAFTKLVYNITNSLQVIPVLNPVSTTTAPVGTTVFDSSTATPRFIINDSDNVGIGTTNAPEKLSVLGRVHIQQDSGSNNRIILRGQPSSLFRWNVDNFGSGNDFRIFREDDATTANGVVAVSISTAGTLTATRFSGDGSLLTGISAATAISTNTTNQNQLIPYATSFGSTTGLGATTLLVYNPSTGNLGIGSTSPTSRLSVVGDGFIIGVVTANSFRARGGAPGAIGVNNNGYGFFGSGDNDSGMYSSADGQIEFYSNSVEVARINSSQNVGIGTTNPSQTGAGSKVHISGGNLKLDSNNDLVWDGTFPTYISGSSGSSGGSLTFNAGNSRILRYTASGGGSNISDLSPTVTNTIDLGRSSLQYRNTWIGGNLFVGAASSTGTASQTLQVTGGAYVSGSVGIGITNPGANANGTLQVNGTIGLAPNSQIRQWTNSDGGTLQVFATQIVSSSTNSGSSGYADGGLIAATTNSDGALLLDAGRVGSNTTRFRVGNTTSSNCYMQLGSTMYADTGSNRVGIATISSAFTLDVNGDARIRGTNAMRFGGTSGTTNFFIQYNSTTNSLDFVAG